ncbi:transcription factor PCL1-like [Bidens hawaiensis]|uniref:transcription factor PCL1-like n=1 Tax=Bidens hawaiensis TaxID=980011 RepID=UPI00404B7BC2
MDWEAGLPPLSHLLISLELASAFNITPEPHRSMTDVTHASRTTLLTLNSSISSSDEREDHESSARSSKRIRLVWTPELHKLFAEVVKHLGVKKAVPKIIMQLMNVEGLTRENVASHLQKYRLYVKRMPGLSDRTVGVGRRASVSVPYMVPPMTYPSPHMVHHHGFDYHYNMMMHNFGSVSPYQHGMTSNDK